MNRVAKIVRVMVAAVTILQYGVLRRQYKFCRHILNTDGFMHENFEALASLAVTLTS